MMICRSIHWKWSDKPTFHVNNKAFSVVLATNCLILQSQKDIINSVEQPVAGLIYAISK